MTKIGAHKNKDSARYLKINNLQSLCVPRQEVKLENRTVMGTSPRPPYSFTQGKGVVVVQIRVDQYGNVTEAFPGAEGTTIRSDRLWAASKAAALKTHFNASERAPVFQEGTITYTFGDLSEKDLTPVKDLVEQHESGVYLISMKFVKTHSPKELFILVEESDYVIPVKLLKKDLGAEKRFIDLNLQEGDSLTISGNLSEIYVGGEKYKGLVDAQIFDMKAGNRELTKSLPVDSAGKRPIIEQKPSFNGGDANEFSKWANKNLKYPKAAKENGIRGRVTVQFTIKADGSLTDVKVLHGVEESLDREAVRVVSSSPKWKPGRSQGKPVDVIYTFPVIFSLD